MAENEVTPLPHFQSLPELVEYFDTHDMGEHWDGMPEAQFEVDIKRRHRLVSIDADLMSQLSDIAKSQQVAVEDLIEAWLKEKVAGANR
jgi:CopG antitoxin of type II toxin-antitoxin system